MFGVGECGGFCSSGVYVNTFYGPGGFQDSSVAGARGVAASEEWLNSAPLLCLERFLGVTTLEGGAVVNIAPQVDGEQRSRQSGILRLV